MKTLQWLRLNFMGFMEFTLYGQTGLYLSYKKEVCVVVQ